MTASKKPHQWPGELGQRFSRCAPQTNGISPTWNLLEMLRPCPSGGLHRVYFNKLSVIQIHPLGERPPGKTSSIFYYLGTVCTPSF